MTVVSPEDREARIESLHRQNAKLERELATHVAKIRNQKTEIDRLSELHLRASRQIEELRRKLERTKGSQ